MNIHFILPNNHPFADDITGIIFDVPLVPRQGEMVKIRGYEFTVTKVRYDIYEIIEPFDNGIIKGETQITNQDVFIYLERI